MGPSGDRSGKMPPPCTIMNANVAQCACFNLFGIMNSEKIRGGGEKEKERCAQRGGVVSGNGGSLEKASTHICGVPLPGRSQPRLQTTHRKRTLSILNIQYVRNHCIAHDSVALPLPSSRKPRPPAAAAAAAAEDSAAEGAQNDCTEEDDDELSASRFASDLPTGTELN